MSGASRRNIEDERTRRRIRRAERGKFIVGEEGSEESEGEDQVMEDEAKKSLIRNYGLDSVEPLSITKLEKKYGECIYEKLQPYIVETPKSKAIKWDA